jgi:hypothetical protein
MLYERWMIEEIHTARTAAQVDHLFRVQGSLRQDTQRIPA